MALPVVLIYNDEATSSAIPAAVVIEPSIFLSGSVFSATLSEQVDPDRIGISPDASLIYGIALLAAFATIFALRDSPIWA